MQKRVIIIAGGEVAQTDLDIIKEDDIIITADAGIVPLLHKGIHPHHAVGDFDTLDSDLLKKIKQLGISLKKLPIHKEETDTHHAACLAMEYSPQEVLILGALGGARLDHMLGNVGLLEWLADRGIVCALLHRSNRIRLLKGPVTWEIKRSSFAYISLIPITIQVSGVTTQGLMYSLIDQTLYRGATQGISNELVGEQGFVFIERGKCLGIESKDL